MAATLYIQGEAFMQWDSFNRGEIPKKQICEYFLKSIEEESKKYHGKPKEWIRENFFDGPYTVFEAEKHVAMIKEAYNLAWHKKQRHQKFPTFLDFFSQSRFTSIIYK